MQVHMRKYQAWKEGSKVAKRKTRYGYSGFVLDKNYKTVI